MLREASEATPAALMSIDPADGSIDGTVTLTGADHRMAVNRALNRIFVARRSVRTGLEPDILRLDVYDSSLVLIQSSAPLGDSVADAPAKGGIVISPDGSRVHVTTTPLEVSGSIARAYHHHVFDAVTLARLSVGVVSVPDNPAALRTRSELVTVGKSLENRIPPAFYIARTPLDGSGSTNIITAETPRAMAVAMPETLAIYASYFNGVYAVDLNTGAQFESATYGTADPMRVDRNALVVTPPGAASCTYALDSRYASFPQVPAAGVAIHVSTDCQWSATDVVRWLPRLPPWLRIDTYGGTGNGTVTITALPNTTGVTRKGAVIVAGQVVTVTQAGPSTQPPFGAIDTPVIGATGLGGSVAITGWALDDIGIAAVRLFRDPVDGEPQSLIPVGGATLVDGARADVQAAYPTLPFASRGGWGYMLLTNMLPRGGNGIYRLHVYAEDIDGQSVLLGTRTIAVDNVAASLPFGTIDTPGQGETVSGVITNWGWALTPPLAFIPLDGSTIDVIVDGVAVGHPTFGLNRPDIAALFPGYANTNSAVGYFTIDTTTLTDGVHTIAWIVRDSLGRAQGIGSRYFTVRNP